MNTSKSERGPQREGSSSLRACGVWALAGRVVCGGGGGGGASAIQRQPFVARTRQPGLVGWHHALDPHRAPYVGRRREARHSTALLQQVPRAGDNTAGWIYLSALGVVLGLHLVVSCAQASKSNGLSVRMCKSACAFSARTATGTHRSWPWRPYPCTASSRSRTSPSTRRRGPCRPRRTQCRGSP